MLLCDLDDTLVDSAAAFRHWAKAFAAAHDQDGLLNWLVGWEKQVQGDGAPRDLFEALHQRLRPTASVDDLIDAYYRELIPLLRCEHAVVWSLVRVRERGWSVAIVTNGGPRQEDKIRGTGLDRFVDAWCVSEIEGARKPGVRLLAIAAERCGESLSDAWMIGDGPDTDIAAADAGGIPSVWLHRGRAWPREDFRPTYEAASFAEAVEVVLNNANVA
jgi:putative hydrolase of the HAD superfamily